MTAEHERTGALEAIERILNRGGDGGDVLRDVVRTLSRHYSYVGVRFVADEGLVDGPSVGEAPSPRGQGGKRYAVTYEGRRVAQLEVTGTDDADDRFLERVATLISAECSWSPYAGPATTA